MLKRVSELKEGVNVRLPDATSSVTVSEARVVQSVYASAVQEIRVSRTELTFLNRLVIEPNTCNSTHRSLLPRYVINSRERVTSRMSGFASRNTWKSWMIFLPA